MQSKLLIVLQNTVLSRIVPRIFNASGALRKVIQCRMEGFSDRVWWTSYTWRLSILVYLNVEFEENVRHPQARQPMSRSTCKIGHLSNVGPGKFSRRHYQLSLSKKGSLSVEIPTSRRHAVWWFLRLEIAGGR